MKKQKESKLNWALTVVDSEEAPNVIKFQGKTEANEGLGVGRKSKCAPVY